jgi:anion-transporting  ArsA/GET3 family ATPase
VVVNMLIDQSQVNADSPEFVRNRVGMQTRYMQDIWEKFDGMVRATVPLYETEVRGTASLARMGGALFAEPAAVPGAD